MLQPAQAKLRIDHRLRIVGGTHAAAADRAIDGIGAAADLLQQAAVILDAVEIQLARPFRHEGPCPPDAAPELDACQHQLEVVRMTEALRIDATSVVSGTSVAGPLT